MALLLIYVIKCQPYNDYTLIGWTQWVFFSENESNDIFSLQWLFDKSNKTHKFTVILNKLYHKKMVG